MFAHAGTLENPTRFFWCVGTAPGQALLQLGLMPFLGADRPALGQLFACPWLSARRGDCLETGMGNGQGLWSTSAISEDVVRRESRRTRRVWCLASAGPCGASVLNCFAVAVDGAACQPRVARHWQPHTSLPAHHA